MRRTSLDLKRGAGLKAEGQWDLAETQQQQQQGKSSVDLGCEREAAVMGTLHPTAWGSCS